MKCPAPSKRGKAPMPQTSHYHFPGHHDSRMNLPSQHTLRRIPKRNKEAVTMPLELHHCTESDLTPFAYIFKDAFSSGEPGMMHLLSANSLSPDYMQKSINKHVQSFREEKDVTYLKIIDTDRGGKMIAGAKWRINKKERTEEQIQSMLPVPGADEEGRQGVQDFMWFLNRVRREYMGTRPFYCELEDTTFVF